MGAVHAWRNLFGVSTSEGKTVQIMCRCGDVVERSSIDLALAAFEQHVVEKTAVIQERRRD